MLRRSSTVDRERTDSLRRHRFTEPRKLAVQVSGNTAQWRDNIGICIGPDNRRLEQGPLRAVFSVSRSLYRSRRTLFGSASSDSAIDRYQWTVHSQQHPTWNLHDMGYLPRFLHLLPNHCLVSVGATTD